MATQVGCTSLPHVGKSNSQEKESIPTVQRSLHYRALVPFEADCSARLPASAPILAAKQSHRGQGVTTSAQTDSFSCQMWLPMDEEVSDQGWVLVLGLFRRIRSEDLNFWLMPQGRSRSDRDLAEDVLLELQQISKDTYAPLREIDIPSILGSERATTLIVSIYLSILQSQDGGQVQTIQSLQRHAHGALDSAPRAGG